MSASPDWVAGPFLEWVTVGSRTVASAEGPFLRLISSGDDGESHVSANGLLQPSYHCPATEPLRFALVPLE
jgi:hypothetical protein